MRPACLVNKTLKEGDNSAWIAWKKGKFALYSLPFLSPLSLYPMMPWKIFCIFSIIFVFSWMYWATFPDAPLDLPFPTFTQLLPHLAPGQVEYRAHTVLHCIQYRAHTDLLLHTFSWTVLLFPMTTYLLLDSPILDTRISFVCLFGLRQTQGTPPGFWNGLDWRALVKLHPLNIGKLGGWYFFSFLFFCDKKLFLTIFFL